jgi:hypothetical protein
MAVPAVLFAIVTVLVGVIVLGDVVGEAGSRLKKLAATHVVVAAAGVTVLLIALVDASRVTLWVSFLALLVAGFIGLATLTWNRRPDRDPAQVPEGQAHLPLPVVVIHGAAAGLTLLLVLLTAGSRGVLH